MEDNIFRNDHDLLIRIDTRLQDLIRDNNEYKISLGKLEAKKCDRDEFTNRVAKHEKDIDFKLKDHEGRMRKLERFVWIATGGLTILQIILKC